MKNKHRLKRYKGRNRHHLKARMLGGDMSINNLLLIYCNRHEIWHKLFGLKNIPQVIALLERVERAKKHQTKPSFWLEGEIPIGREYENQTL